MKRATVRLSTTCSCADRETTGRKLAFAAADKFLLAIVAAVMVGVLQNRLELAEERLEKARQISDIAVDRPLAIVAKLPEHIDRYIAYASHVRAGDVAAADPAEVTELETTISADVEGSMAFYSGDGPLRSKAELIRTTIANNKATILTKGVLSTNDMIALEALRRDAYAFHERVTQLSVLRTFDNFDVAYGRKTSLWQRLMQKKP